MPSSTHPVSVRLSAESEAYVTRYAKLTKRSKSFVINEAVENQMKDRVQYLEELEAAVEDAKSGYGHSSEQVHTWMKSMGTEDKTPTPKPDLTPEF